ncbi:hypothetical protein L1987_19174 [Smallanthus sonchifolius]|uniref:Uncharacterized protein n=1 Tax=Smallanthus sonchifolius TaxID=185202 RepID=A0ACB9J1K9_9ASTR|nr:hypothetical protein L1987_19174 [Smallanthus sonchifolius]
MPHSPQPPHTRVAVVGDSTGTVVGLGIGCLPGLEVRAGLNSDGPGIAVLTGEASPDSGTGPEMQAPGYVTGVGPGPALDGPIEPGCGFFYVLDRNPWKCGVFGHNEDIDKPPLQPRVVDPIAEPQVVDPVCVDPQIARTKGKDIMEDGFIKVTKKKKKNNGPKPRVQIPSLHVSKPGPSKPLGRARPNVITRVTVSNPFEALDDVNQIDNGFPELNAT